jgi:hypothetical protein
LGKETRDVAAQLEAIIATRTGSSKALPSLTSSPALKVAVQCCTVLSAAAVIVHFERSENAFSRVIEDVCQPSIAQQPGLAFGYQLMNVLLVLRDQSCFTSMICNTLVLWFLVVRQEYEALQAKPAAQLTSEDRVRLVDLEGQLQQAQEQLQRAQADAQRAEQAAAAAERKAELVASAIVSLWQ